ncbi:hypothetical protein BGZ98_004228 [Dissophora globulifera]|nr:hypothetical protein BGZ98_004228 [Dissophora globulifera]
MSTIIRHAGTAKPTASASAQPTRAGYGHTFLNKQINAKASTSTTKPTTPTTSASAKNYAAIIVQSAASATKASAGTTPCQQAYEAIRQQVTVLSSRVDTQLKSWQDQCTRINEHMEMMEQKIVNLLRLIS